MTVALFTVESSQMAGIRRHATGLMEALSKLGVEIDPVMLRRREARIAGRAVGGIVSLWGERLRPRRRPWRLVHVVDPLAAIPRADVVTVHDLFPETHPDEMGYGLADRLDWRLSRRLCKNARVLLANSAVTRNEVIRRWGVPDEKVRVILHAIDQSRYHRVGERSAWLAPDRPTLVYLGPDNARKNFALAVEALAPLRERHGVEARLVRVGSPAGRSPRWKVLAEAQGLDVVETGFLDDAEVRALLSSASLFVWPSLLEGFGLPPIEAMRCGLPTAALDLPINREVLGDLATYAREPTPEAFAAAIAEGLAKRPSVEALVRASEPYGFARVAREVLDVYRELGGP